jgi:hypothetical protein
VTHDDRDERDELVAGITQSVSAGTYDIPAEEVAKAIMSGPFLAYLRRLSLFDLRRLSEPPEQENDQ